MLPNRGRLYFLKELSLSRAGGAWVEYKEAGVYQVYDELSLRAEVYLFLTHNNLPVSDHFVNEAIKRIKTIRLKRIDDFDRRNLDDPIINTLDGLWHVKYLYLQKHTPEYLSLNQYQCRFTIEVPKTQKDVDHLLPQIEDQMPCWMDMKKHYPKSMDTIERYSQAIFRKDVFIKLVLVIVGGTNSGKSTVSNVLQDIFGDVASFLSISALKESFGLAALIGKIVNFDTDSSMGKYANKIIGILKSLVGDPDSPINTRIMYVGWIKILFDVFFVIISNQLSMLPPDVDRKSFFKRVAIAVMDHQFEDDPEFEQKIRKEKDAVFTYLCLKPYKSLERTDFESYVKHIQELWDFWSNPVKQIVMELYERSNDIDAQIEVEDVMSEIEEIMSDRGLRTSTETKGIVTQTLAGMKIKKRRKQKDGIKCDMYVAIKRKKEEYIEPPEDDDDPSGLDEFMGGD